MSFFDRTPAKYADDDLPWIGAKEITSFAGRAANDNSAADGMARGRFGGAHRTLLAKTASWGLPMAAFASGLTAALVVTGLGEFLGLGG